MKTNSYRGAPSTAAKMAQGNYAPALFSSSFELIALMNERAQGLPCTSDDDQ